MASCDDEEGNEFQPGGAALTDTVCVGGNSKEQWSTDTNTSNIGLKNTATTSEKSNTTTPEPHAGNLGEAYSLSASG